MYGNYERKEVKRKKIKVEPSNNIFKELGNNNYNFVELLSELIDNSLAARLEEKLLNVQISIGYSESNPTDSYLIIKDNAKGINYEALGSAISPAAQSGGGGINEHGLGMKQAVASLGTLKYLATKYHESLDTMYVYKFAYGEIDVEIEENSKDEHGTTIYVENIKPIVPIPQQKYTMSILPYLGAKYRRYLKEDNTKMKISIALLDIDNIDENGNPSTIFNKVVEPIKPVYFHPNERKNKPYRKRTFKGVGWEALFTFGYAPTDEEYDELGMEKPENYMPYYVSINKQGFDLIEFERVVNFAQLASIGIVNNVHNDYNYIRGEIELIRGFETSTTKNYFIRNEHFMQLTNSIRDFLKEERLLERKNDPSEIPESLLRDRLADYLLTNPLYFKNEVRTEYSVGRLNGYIDVFADNTEAWEVKKGQCSGTDIYQLFAYMDMGGIQKGFLLANEFTTGAEEAREFINTKHKVNITFVKLEHLPILHPASIEERRQHYR